MLIRVGKHGACTLHGAELERIRPPLMAFADPHRINTWMCYWDVLAGILQALKVKDREVDQVSRENWHACKRRDAVLRDKVRDTVDPGLDVSSCFSKEYQPEQYQLKAGQRNYVVGRLLNADPVGMGKTLSSWVTAEIIRREQGQCKTVVICLASLKWQWRSELLLYTNERMKALVVTGTQEERTRIYTRFAEAKGSATIILNYDLLMRDAYNGLSRAIDSADYVITDEASKLKNRGTKTTKAYKLLTQRVKWKSALTATPIEVGVENLHSIMESLDPLMLGTMTLYKGTYTKSFPIKLKTGKTIYKPTGYRNLPDLNHRVAARRVRRLPQDEGVHLPEIRAQVIWAELGPKQRSAYDSAVSGVLRGLEEDKDVNPMVVVGDALRACLSGALVGAAGPGIKSTMIVDQLSDESADEQALVFSESKAYLRDELVPMLQKAGVKAELLCGDTSMMERQQMQRSFNAEELRVLCMTSAGERGLNLPCGLVLDVDVPWNPSRLTQRAGRARRYGSKYEHVRVLNYLTLGTVEERVLERVLGRRSLSEAVVGAEESDNVGYKLTSRDLSTIL